MRVVARVQGWSVSVDTGLESLSPHGAPFVSAVSFRPIPSGLNQGTLREWDWIQRLHGEPEHFTCSQLAVLGSKLPGRVLPEHPIDVRLWLTGAVDLGEIFWLAVDCEYLGRAILVGLFRLSTS